MKRTVAELADAFLRLFTHTGAGHDDSLFAEDCVMRCKVFNLNGLAEIRKHHLEMRKEDLAWRIFELGNTAAVLYRARFKRTDGTWGTAEGIELVEANEQGKICRVVGYFDPDDYVGYSDATDILMGKKPVKAAG